MKKILSLITIAILLTSCNQKNDKLLEEGEQLMYENADSALTFLYNHKDSIDLSNKAVNNKYCTLVAMSKCMLGMSEDGQYLVSLLSYCEDNNIDSKYQIMLCYCIGCLDYDNGAKNECNKYIARAVNAITGDESPYLLERVYNIAGRSTFKYREALDYYIKSYNYAKTAKDTFYLKYACRDLSTQYKLCKDYKNAMSYIKSAKRYTRADDYKFNSMLNERIADLYLVQQKTDSAFVYISSSMIQRNTLSAKERRHYGSNIFCTYARYYFLKGRISNAIEVLDSAKNCCSNNNKFTNSVMDKYKLLLFDILKNKDSSAVYSKTKFDSIFYKNRMSEYGTDTTSVSNYLETEKVFRISVWPVVIVVIVAVLIFSVYFFIERNRRNKRKDEFINNMVKRYSNSMPICIDRNSDDWIAYTNVINRLKKNVVDLKVVDAYELNDLKKYEMRFVPELANLTNILLKANYISVEMVYLLIAGFSTKEVAILMGNKTQNISNKKKAIAVIFMKDKNVYARDLSKILESYMIK